jgi:hypothetical protein
VLIAPRTDPYMRSLAHTALIADDSAVTLRLMKKGSAPGMPFRGYVCIHSLRPDDSLTILSMASSIGFELSCRMAIA